MQRRVAIKNLLYATGAVVFLPSCNTEDKSAVLLNQIKVTAAQEDLLAALTETIIPATDTPGAKELGAHLFVLTMVDDCFKKEDQDKFIAGMQNFTQLAKDKFKQSFAAGSKQEREAMLLELEVSKNNAAGVDFFYKSVKRLTIQAYTTSEYFLTKVQEYKLVPGHFKGCVKISNAS